jgi:hypothetical protein
MDDAILKTFGQVAGIGGLALGVFLLLYQQLLQRVRPASLTPKQWYRVIIVFMLLVWSLAIVGIAAWILAEFRTHSPAALDVQGSMSALISTPVPKNPKVDNNGDTARSTAVASPETSAPVTKLSQSNSFELGGGTRGSIEIIAELAPDGILRVRYMIRGGSPTHSFFEHWQPVSAAPVINLEDEKGNVLWTGTAPRITCRPGSVVRNEKDFAVPESVLGALSKASRIRLEAH